MWLWCAEQVMRSKSSSNTPPWPLHWLLPSGSWSIWVLLTSFEDELRCGSINQINSFFPNLLGLVLQQRNVNSKTSWDHKRELVLKSRLPLFHFTSGFSLNFYFFLRTRLRCITLTDASFLFKLYFFYFIIEVEQNACCIMKWL